MRALPCLLLLAACHPSATVEHTMPIASLQSYRTVALRVHSSAFASQGEAMYLESAVLDQLHKRCGFERVEENGGAPADVVLDLNVTHTQRGTTGFISNPNVAVMDTLLVLSDGQTGDLLGTASIEGKSAGMVIQGIDSTPPESQAAGAVAKAVVSLLATSGCSGPRVARAAPPATGSGAGPGSAEVGQGAGSAAAGSGAGSAAPPVDDARRKQAEALDTQGKDKMYVADVAGALALFQQAVALVPDPRYEFNVCLALGAQKQWDPATAACQKARTMNPSPELADKIDRRIQGLAQHQ